MSFLIYFFVLLVSVASVLFGLDLMSSPLPSTPNVPIGRSVQISPQPLPRQAKTADERAATPVRPAELVKPPPQTTGDASRQQAKLPSAPPPDPVPQQQAAAAPPRADVAQAAPSQPVEQARTEPAAAPAASQQAANSCNREACAAAYQSFRASDCSYQPIDGPRRACAITGRPAAAALPVRASPRSQPAARNAELREGERIVKRPPLDLRPERRRSVSRDNQRPAGGDDMSEVERIVRHMTRDEAGDIPVQDADGRIFIVRKSYR